MLLRRVRDAAAGRCRSHAFRPANGGASCAPLSPRGLPLCWWAGLMEIVGSPAESWHGRRAIILRGLGDWFGGDSVRS
jgi:hypothetical protein